MKTIVWMGLVLLTVISMAGCTRLEKTAVWNESCGFRINPIPGYTVTQYPTGMTMYPDPFDPVSGPGVAISQTVLGVEVDLAHVVSVAYKRHSDYAFSDPVSMTVSGMDAVLLPFTTAYRADDGVVLDYYGADEGEMIQGWLVLVLRDPQTLFEVLMLAPQDEWRKALPLYEDVLASIQFVQSE